MASAVQESLINIRPSTDRHKFSVVIPERSPSVIADLDKLNQVLTNLFGNSVKYSPAGGMISISAVHDPEPEFVVISIQDEGIEIAPEHQGILFTPFGMVRTPETAEIDGPGLGLYLVKELVGAMGGEVWVESQTGLGSTFFFCLPANGKSPLQDISKELAEPMAPPDTQSVLIADDEANVRLLLQTTLRNSPYRILLAKDGPEALEIARAEIPQLALLDVMMPGMEGFEVCRLLKNEPATAGIKIIMLTARSQKSDRQKGREAGADGYIAKPFSPSALLRTISGMLEDDPVP